MKQTRDFPAIQITDKGKRFIDSGHVWVYAAEITHVCGKAYNDGDPVPFDNGEIVDVVSSKGRYIGTGLWSSLSKIRVRIISDNINDTYDNDFWCRRIRYSIDYRRTVMGKDFPACRLIFGEADRFPGLTVDLFNDIIVTESLSYGIDIRRDTIYNLLCEVLSEYGVSVRGIYERSESPLRAKEGLLPVKGWYEGIPHSGDTTTIISENGIKYKVDFENGQKTGFFLDQKYNRAAAARIAAGKKVLDCFTHTGSFALNCAINGAESVTAVDISETALDSAKENAELNGIEKKIEFVKSDVFDLLTDMSAKGGHPYDMIILDPPAFTKSRDTVGSAERGYKEINLRAMKLLPRGGYLATCSCSHFMTDDMFRSMLADAARDANVSIRQIERRQQAPDHPILFGVPETDYLKFYILQIV